ncbi:MAG: bifunctional [glutamate--ammonia ligase]-adenylyl-L-tyrosine phosphorylase/[glutamate--ammonia-ligase] adenylyltransferase [Gammaproteobacteria bacterium]|nr:MAG: bifunctional [glutamate--ammonia ligase]-adenylyl-L-tyrosine phosphorylase/[glutamate--ammonia-ligase] adenylyltransferase [Gammaproteobacteria bacterium]
MTGGSVPERLASTALVALGREREAAWRAALQDAGLEVPGDARFHACLRRVFALSPFVFGRCVRDPGLLPGLLADGDLLADRAEGAVEHALARRLAGVSEEADLRRALRRFRNREMVRIAWRDLAGWAPLEETLLDLSDLAEACVRQALEKLEAWQRRARGTPRDASGRVQRLVVVAMGKLGGRELNFSSDIDLVFAYPAAGWIRRPRRLSHEEWFTELGRRLIGVLSDVDAEGFVFRVDMRLRPFGDSGPLVADFAMLEDYYASQGREWERYALVKARPITGDPAHRAELEALLAPFVYRRYLDYGTLAALREMKALIERDMRRRGRGEDLKLGRGGIREIEFIVQAFQLIRGGREPRLRTRGLLPTLQALGELGHLSPEAVRELEAAYRFLRCAENRLQAQDDAQTQALPHGEVERAALAEAMGCADWTAFRAALEGHRHRVHARFAALFGGAATPGVAAPLAALWEASLEEDEARAALRASGYGDPAWVLRRLADFREQVAGRLGDRGRGALARLMPEVLAVAGRAEVPEAALGRVLDLLEAIAGRTAYLMLLAEHPPVVARLVHLCAASPFIAGEIRRHPLLLDELLDARLLEVPPDRHALAEQLARRLASLPEGDLEAQMERLREFRNAAVLRIAAADLSGHLEVPQVGTLLTTVAELVLEAVRELAWDALVARHGVPRRRDGGEAGFLLVGYGKLGGRELGYGSDLDLVFLHDGDDAGRTDGRRPLENGLFFARLGQRVIHMLNTLTPSGVLYEVDVRLRPSGASGLLVSSLEAFARYQREEAWTWEHQALVRARPVAGPPALAQAFARIRQEVLCRPRDARRLQQEVVDMRRRMREALTVRGGDRFDLKQGAGGLVDIEFLVQYLVLRHAPSHPELAAETSTLGGLRRLAALRLLGAREAQTLEKALLAYRGEMNRLALREAPAVVPQARFRRLREAVRRTWRRVMESDL